MYGTANDISGSSDFTDAEYPFDYAQVKKNIKTLNDYKLLMPYCEEIIYYEYDMYEFYGSKGSYNFYTFLNADYSFDSMEDSEFQLLINSVNKVEIIPPYEIVPERGNLDIMLLYGAYSI